MKTVPLSKERKEKLKGLEEVFFSTYPGGFEDEGLLDDVKRHAGQKRTDFAREVFRKECFTNPEEIVKDMARLVSRSSMVSIFEKKRFNYFSKHMTLEQKELLTIGLEEIIHGSFKNGLEIMSEVLGEDNLAKWSLITIIPYYYAPQKHIFVKPTTTKKIINYFYLDEVKYKPKPYWEFYAGYKRIINEMKKSVDKRLGGSNAKFTAFLMMAIEIEAEDTEILSMHPEDDY